MSAEGDAPHEIEVVEVGAGSTDGDRVPVLVSHSVNEGIPSVCVAWLKSGGVAQRASGDRH